MYHSKQECSILNSLIPLDDINIENAIFWIALLKFSFFDMK